MQCQTYWGQLLVCCEQTGGTWGEGWLHGERPIKTCHFHNYHAYIQSHVCQALEIIQYPKKRKLGGGI